MVNESLLSVWMCVRGRGGKEEEAEDGEPLWVFTERATLVK